MKHERDTIRTEVFNRDNNRCIIPGCDFKPDDAHHLIERKLWDNSENGGYILENMVSLCEYHHKMAENNTILPISLRKWAGIKSTVLPKSMSFEPGNDYDKWGKKLEIPARDFIKYPHTPYLPFSPGVDENDIEESGYMQLNNLLNKPLSITIKMDGSNLVMTDKYIAARNGYDATHTSFDMAKQFHAQIKSQIPENLMIFGEWLYAKHSIHYTGELKLNYLYQVFGIYDRFTHIWLDRLEEKEIVSRIDNNQKLISHVRELNLLPEKDLIFSEEKKLREFIIKTANQVIKEGHEGIVIRNVYAFHHSRWPQNIAKYVRPNHVQTSKHWKELPVVKNEFSRTF